MKRKKMKPFVAWIEQYPGGTLSGLIRYTAEDVKLSKCIDKCSGRKPGRFVKLRLTEIA